MEYKDFRTFIPDFRSNLRTFANGISEILDPSE